MVDKNKFNEEAQLWAQRSRNLGFGEGILAAKDVLGKAKIRVAETTRINSWWDDALHQLKERRKQISREHRQAVTKGNTAEANVLWTQYLTAKQAFSAAVENAIQTEKLNELRSITCAEAGKRMQKFWEYIHSSIPKMFEVSPIPETDGLTNRRSPLGYHTCPEEVERVIKEKN